MDGEHDDSLMCSNDLRALVYGVSTPPPPTMVNGAHLDLMGYMGICALQKLRGVNGCGIVLLSPCFRETVVVVTCKIGSFLCSLDNLLQKNVIVFFLKIKFQNGAHLKKKRGYF